MSLYRDQGVVLRTIKLGEADRIVTIFTQTNGKVRAVAKGIRRPGRLCEANRYAQAGQGSNPACTVRRAHA